MNQTEHTSQYIGNILDALGIPKTPQGSLYNLILKTIQILGRMPNIQRRNTHG